MAEEFVAPEFLTIDTDADTIHQKMLDMLPDDIDKTEGGFPWDFTRPTALIAAELLQFYAPEILKLMFPQWSRGTFLDYLGEMAQLVRKSATCSTAVLTVRGVEGTIIKEGTVFCTEATDDAASIEYAAMETCTIDESGSVEVLVQAVVSGIGSNVNAGTIVLMSKPIGGVTYVSNGEAATGGTEEESDDDFRERILEANRNRGVSYVGNNADYKRWAKEVDGIGTAIVIPEWDGPGTVKVVCLDSNGVAANQTLLDAVYNHIMSPDSPYDRLAPIGAVLTVSQPEMIHITYTFEADLSIGYNMDMITEAFTKSLEEYYEAAVEDECLKYIHVHSILTNTAGIEDFVNLRMNGSMDNIKIQLGQYPYTEKIEGVEYNDD